MRFATKGPAVMPMKILTDTPWLDAISAIVEKGRKLNKEVVIHTHFNNPNEISWITEKAMNLLFERGITVRNQSVLIRGVNDDPEVMQLLVRRLSYLNVHPYYVYMHDLVKGVEELRTPIQTSIDIEKFVRGSTAGFNTPLFICDAPGGGGLLGPERQTGEALRVLRSHRHALARGPGALAAPGHGRGDDRRSDREGGRSAELRSGVAFRRRKTLPGRTKTALVRYVFVPPCRRLEYRES
jgi:L-lysine 2,3-aminomutase